MSVDRISIIKIWAVLRLSQCGLGGLLIQRKCAFTRQTDSSFIDLVFMGDFPLTDKFSVLNYLANKETTHINQRLKVASSLCEWLTKCPEQITLSANIKGWQENRINAHFYFHFLFNVWGVPSKSDPRLMSTKKVHF